MRQQDLSASPPFTPTPARVQFAQGIVVGIDPGLDAHGVVALLRFGSQCLRRLKIPNTIDGLQSFVTQLLQWRQQSGGNVTVAIEEASNYGAALEHFLHHAGFDLVLVSAFKVARYREVARLDANDDADAEAVARLLIVQPDLAQPSAQQLARRDPHGDEHQRLRRLSRRHASLTKDLTRTCNELHALLRTVWLCDYQAFFSNLYGGAAAAFWQNFPTPRAALEAGTEAIATVLNQASHGRITPPSAAERARDILRVARRIAQAFVAHPAQRSNTWADDIREVAAHLAHIAAHLRALEKQMDELLDQLHQPLTSFKGLGTVIAATLLGEMLSVRRFPTADHFARYNGTAPRESSSGRSQRHVKNHCCNHRLKRALLQLALIAPRYHDESQIYLNHLQQLGHTGGRARLRLARRLSDLLYAMLKSNTPYSVDYFHQHRRKKSA